jgi:hypothetical protein
MGSGRIYDLRLPGNGNQLKNGEFQLKPLACECRRLGGNANETYKNR